MAEGGVVGEAEGAAVGAVVGRGRAPGSCSIDSGAGVVVMASPLPRRCCLSGLAHNTLLRSAGTRCG